MRTKGPGFTRENRRSGSKLCKRHPEYQRTFQKGIVSVETSGVDVKWLNAPKTIMERTDCFGRLELLTNPLDTTLLAH